MRQFVLGLVLFGLVSTSIQWKLNVPRVLLPLTEEGAYYKLFSEGGCFDWKSSRPEVGTSKTDSYISISQFIIGVSEHRIFTDVLIESICSGNYYNTNKWRWESYKWVLIGGNG